MATKLYRVTRIDAGAWRRDSLHDDVTLHITAADTGEQLRVSFDQPLLDKIGRVLQRACLQLLDKPSADVEIATAAQDGDDNLWLHDYTDATWRNDL